MLPNLAHRAAKPWKNKAEQLHVQLSTLGLKTFIGIEKEFYISHALAEREFLELEDALGKQYLWKLVKEDGKRQFEYHTEPTADIAQLFKQVEAIEAGLDKLTNHHIIFQHKPYAKEPACGLHVHIHMEDAQGKKLFFKQDDACSDVLKRCIAALMYHMSEAAAILLLDATPGRFAKLEDHTTTKVSWGFNNRTTAIRLPDSGAESKRLEFRLASNENDLALLLSILLAAFIDGAQREYELPRPIYGNANDEQYQLTSLPRNLAEAEKILSQKIKLRHALA